MPNPRSGNLPDDRKDSGMPPKQRPGHMPTEMPMKTASWPGLPGKTQPRPRGKAKKVNHYVKSEGL